MPGVTCIVRRRHVMFHAAGRSGHHQARRRHCHHRLTGVGQQQQKDEHPRNRVHTLEYNPKIARLRARDPVQKYARRGFSRMGPTSVVNNTTMTSAE